MTQMPTKAELDRRLATATKAMKLMTVDAAKIHCITEKGRAEAEWHPAVAKGYVDLLRAEYRKRFKK
jgi:hypothetical protein